MITLGNWATQAVEKLDKEKKTVSGRKEETMAAAVMATLKDFCVQNEEFAQAIVQGGSFGECMREVAKGVGNSISDIDAYKKAVKFYFPGANVSMKLSIDLIGAAADEKAADKAPSGGGLILDFSSIL